MVSEEEEVEVGGADVPAGRVFFIEDESSHRNEVGQSWPWMSPF